MEQVQTRRKAQFFRSFVEHPASVGESYFEHMRFAGSFGVVLLGAAGAAFVHAIIPPLFETTASRLIKSLHQRMEARH